MSALYRRLTTRRPILIVALLTVVAAWSFSGAHLFGDPAPSSARPANAQGSPVRVQYEPSQENIPNPERGFFHAQSPFYLNTERHPLDVQALSPFRENGITVVKAYYVIDEFREGPISRQALDAIAADFTAVRQAGVKIIPRFAYSFPCAGSLQPCDLDNSTERTDVEVSRVLNHIDQLTPLLRASSDVIAFLEVGLVGAWGEWHHSSSRLVDADTTPNANSAAIVDRVLSALPDTRMAAQRYPHQKQALVGVQPLDPTEAFNRTARARLGAHNDCFLANAHDAGTYTAPRGPFTQATFHAQRAYASLDNRFVPQGGETCSTLPDAQPYIGCANALRDLASLHWSVLNLDYQLEVIGLWKQQGCFGEIQKRLGYRFRLVDAILPDQAAAGGALTLTFTVANDGWAAPYNPRLVEIVMRNTATGRVITVPVTTDPRLWAAGELRTVTVNAGLPADLDLGTYQLLLNLPDPEATLYRRPEYSIRLANVGLWDASTGYNDLQGQVAILRLAAPSALTGSSSGSSVNLAWNPPAAGPTPTAYAIEVGSASGLTDLANVITASTTFSATGVPPGIYFLRVRALIGTTSTPATNELALVVGSGCSTPPGPPGLLAIAAISGGMATLTWAPAPGFPSTYLIEVGSRPGLSDVAMNDLRSAATSLTASAVPGGTYYVRIRARNACGTGSASNEVTVTVG